MRVPPQRGPRSTLRLEVSRAGTCLSLVSPPAHPPGRAPGVPSLLQRPLLLQPHHRPGEKADPLTHMQGPRGPSPQSPDMVGPFL